VSPCYDRQVCARNATSSLTERTGVQIIGLLFYHLTTGDGAPEYPHRGDTACTCARFHTSRDRCVPAFSLVALAVAAL
jgi:hypothetical protein